MINKFFFFCLIKLIQIYKFIFSPFLGTKCRYLPSCSDYFIESLEVHGFFNGIMLGTKRIFSCHPIKVLGGGSGLDLVPKKRKK